LQAKLGPDVRIEAWGKAWVSREGRLPRLLAARTSDFVVCTPDRLILFATGFFTRLARRRVYDEALADLTIREVPGRRGVELRVARRDASRSLLFDLSSKPRNTLLASRLLQLTTKDDPA